MGAPSDADTWEGLTSPEILGGWAVDGGSGGLSPGIVASTSGKKMPPLYSPENPLFWVGVVVLLVTGGLYVSAHWKVGPAKGSVTV